MVLKSDLAPISWVMLHFWVRLAGCYSARGFQGPLSPATISIPPLSTSFIKTNCCKKIPTGCLASLPQVAAVVTDDDGVDE
ncbi:hypothetical protein N656DRAFT_8913 [Canariomyces notabilis]|uniref:Secreted protein n=1 Tax=Canariomyces notabilis TaxID=2074819 RepID=A0AAN6TMA4_9PEZI|nr:hypothetical protein N656DRAFT_8913 [Canariomyces arenarius]